MEIVRFALTLAAAVLLGVTAEWWRRRRARRQAAILAQGQTVRIRAWIRGAVPPYPKNLRRGVVVIGDGVTWSKGFRGDIPLSLRVTRTAVSRRGVRISAVDAMGNRVEVEVDGERAELVVDALAAKVPTGSVGDATYSESGIRNLLLWPAVPFALALLWVVVWGFFYFGGETLQATVVTNEDETCDVSWTKGTRSENSEVDCNDERPGDVLRVRVLRAPLDGEALDLELSPIIFVAGGLGLASVGVMGAAARVFRQRLSWGSNDLDRRTDTTVRPEELVAPTLAHAEVARVAARRGAMEGWAEGGFTTSDWSGGRVAEFFNSWRFMAVVACAAVAAGLWNPVSSSVALLVCGVGLALPSVWRRRQEKSALDESPRGTAFVILSGHDGGPVALFYRATDVTPWAGADLRRPVPIGLPVAGDCRVFQGRRVVIEIAGQLVGVEGFAEVDDLQFVRGLVNANLLESIRDEDS